MKIRFWLLAIGFWFSLYGLLLADDFYKGKTVRIIVGGSAGGGFDTYSRVMARHMGKHIPGHPAIIVENMTGGATLIAAKYLHSSAKPDGLTFGIFNGALILGQSSRHERDRFRRARVRIPRRPGPRQHGMCPAQGERRYQYGSVVCIKDSHQVGRPRTRQQYQRRCAGHQSHPGSSDPARRRL